MKENNRYTITKCIVDLNKEQEKQLRENNVPIDFPESIASLTEKDIIPEYFENRKDFCNTPVMSIDCDSSKDLDDAFYVEHTSYGFNLSVHIADVSAYVEPCSELDQIAKLRGTSYYLPNLTVPMLPKVLSENLCSLNPGVVRLTLSVIMKIDHEGNLMSYEIVKGKIRSRVKGVYSEVDKLLKGSKDNHLRNKYREVIGGFSDMVALYSALNNQRIKRGAFPVNDDKPIVSVCGNSINVSPRKRGLSEKIIESFMIEANHCVALYLAEHDLPGLFRVQETKANMASYQPEMIQHKSLELASYVHFTSPIRRISDLIVSRIISMHLKGYSNEIIHALFDEELPFICTRATKRSRTAKHVQAKCERFCHEIFFHTHNAERRTGVVVGFNDRNYPIIRMNDYNINVITYALVGGHIGDEYSFNVDIGRTSNKLLAYRLKKLSA